MIEYVIVSLVCWAAVNVMVARWERMPLTTLNGTVIVKGERHVDWARVGKFAAGSLVLLFAMPFLVAILAIGLFFERIGVE